jgi:hypothetical protein
VKNGSALRVAEISNRAGLLESKHSLLTVELRLLKPPALSPKGARGEGVKKPLPGRVRGTAEAVLNFSTLTWCL